MQDRKKAVKVVSTPDTKQVRNINSLLKDAKSGSQTHGKISSGEC